MTTALVIDDEPAICQAFESLLRDINSDVVTAASAEDGLLLIQQQTFDVIVIDVRLPGMDGLTALAQIRRYCQAPVVVMTAHGDLSTAVTAVQNGAFDYLPKPFELDRVTEVLLRAIAESAARSAPHTPAPAAATNPQELVGSSLAMQHLFRQIAMAAQHDAAVLITGESGTGKELVAQAIHHHSARKHRPLVPVHLASLSEGLLERELFGHTAGAFTGAETAQPGMIARADGGTLFLDEIGEAPKSFQVKLLRTMESGEFYAVGASVPQASNFRLISATNAPPEILRSEEQFRQDFFFRLATIEIRVPPLREHLGDVPQLATHFLHQLSGDASRNFTADALRFLQSQPYPGNIRELRNTVIRAAAESSSRSIGQAAVTAASQTIEAVNSTPSEERHNDSSESDLQVAAMQWAKRAMAGGQSASLQTATDIVEQELIKSAMRKTGGNRSAAAQLLGIHRETLRDKLSKHDIRDVPGKS